MDIFAPDVHFDSQPQSSGNSVSVKTNTPDTTLGSTARYIFDANGVPRSAQQQQLATSLGLGAVAPFEGGIGVGAYAASLALGCTAVGYHSQARVASSTALGDQAQALAYRAIALGKNANASGANSIAIGTLSKASAANTVVIGNTATSINIESVVIGDGASSIDNFAVAIGNGALAGLGAVAVGWAADAASDHAIAIGLGADAIFADTIAIGYGSEASASSAVAIGAGANAQFGSSAAFGTGSTTTGINQLVIGSVTSPLSDVWFGRGNSINAQGGIIQQATTIHGEEWGGGSNKAGGDLYIAGGRSTGSGAEGVIKLQTSGSGGGGSSVNALTTRLTISSTAITAAGGAVFSGNLTGNVSGSVTGGTVSGSAMAVLNGAADSGLELRANAGQSRYVYTTTAGTNRFLLNIANADTESGADAGSNFALIAFSDGGGVIDTPLKVDRVAGGHIQLNRPTDITGAVTMSSTLAVTGAATLTSGIVGGANGTFTVSVAVTNGVVTGGT